MADPTAQLLDVIIKVVPTGALSTIGIIFLYQRFISRSGIGKNGNGNGNGNGVKYVQENLCFERGKRITSAVELLQRADELHFAAQKEFTEILHRLDKGVAEIKSHHSIGKN